MAYSTEEKDKIFEMLFTKIEEGKSMRDAWLFGKSKLGDNMPNRQTVYEWLEKDEVKANQYALATLIRADILFDDLLDIVDDTGNDMITLEDGKEVVNHSVIQRDRLRFDARRWMISKMNPKKYSDKLSIDQKTTVTVEQPLFVDDDDDD